MSPAASGPTHNCKWPGCTKVVPQAQWGCAQHWAKLPRRIRDKILNAWDRGRGAGSTAHYSACLEAEAWIRENP